MGACICPAMRASFDSDLSVTIHQGRLTAYPHHRRHAPAVPAVPAPSIRIPLGVDIDRLFGKECLIAHCAGRFSRNQVILLAIIMKNCVLVPERALVHSSTS
jgi:hypothetical protein